MVWHRGSNAGEQVYRTASLIVVGLVAVVLSACSTSVLPGSGDADGGDETSAALGADRRREVTLALTDWTGSRINVAIAETIIERRLNHPVTPSPTADSDDMFARLESGELDAVLELWPSSLTETELAAVSAGQVEDLGPLGVVGRVGWYVPRYLIERDPALATWEGLAAQADLFADPATGGRGRFVGTDPAYAQHDEDLMSTLGLDFEVIFTGSEEGTRDELDRAAAQNEPIVLYWWSPTAEIVEYDLVKVELPDRTEDCIDSFEDGGPLSCDYPVDDLFKAATPGLADTDPDLHRFLEAFSLSTEDQLDMIHQVEYGGRSIAEVATEWVEENEEIWSGWLPDEDR